VIFKAEYAKFIAWRNAVPGSKDQVNGARAHAKKAPGL
jgi:hypothetical protein